MANGECQMLFYPLVQHETDFCKLPSFGILGISILTGFVFIFFPSLSAIVSEQMPYPFISSTIAAFPFVACSAGALLYLQGRIFSEDEWKTLRRSNIVLQVLMTILCVVAVGFACSKHHFAHTHPIDLLIHKGSMQMDKFLAQAQTSKTLGDAVAEYRKRYNQHPPP